MSLHDEILAISGTKPSVYLSKRTFASLITDQFVAAINCFANGGKCFPVGNATVVARMVSAKRKSNGPIEGTLDKKGGDVVIDIVSGNNEQMEVTVEVGFNDGAGNFSNPVSDIIVTVSAMRFVANVGGNSISFNPDKVEYVPSPSVKRRAGADAIIQNSGVKPDEVTRSEGAIAYSGIQTILARYLAKPVVLDLGSLFPALQLGAPLKIDVTNSKEALVIVPDSLNVDPNAICHCAGLGDGIGKLEAGQKQMDAAIAPDKKIGTINVGGLKEAVNPSLGEHTQGFGDAGICITRTMADGITTRVCPSVSIDVASGGTIGWSATAIVKLTRLDIQPVNFAPVDFTPLGVTTNPTTGGIEFKLKVDIEIYGRLVFDLGKLGTIRIGDFETWQQTGTVDEIDVVLVPFLSEDKTLSIKPIIKSVGIGAFDVRLNLLTLLGTPFGSEGAVIGFIGDQIIARVISWMLPGKIREQVVNYLGGAAWPILNFGSWLQLTKWPPGNSYSLWDVKADSILIGASANRENI